MADIKPEVRELKKIERRLEDITERVGSTKRAFVLGILSGAGWIIGFIVAVVGVSWILSLLGFIPGLDKIVGQMQSVAQHWGVPRP
jgi:hypothetical protein